MSDQERFAAIFENVEDCLFFVRAWKGGRFAFGALNPAFLEHTGHSLGEALGRTPTEVLGPACGAILIEHLNKTLRSGQLVRARLVLPVGGREVATDAMFSPVRNVAGRPIGILGRVRDITRLQEAERVLHQSQKMDTLGALAAGVAHDVNNVLTGLLSCLTLLDKYITDPRGGRLLAEGLRSIERGSALTGRLLAFSRKKPLRMEVIDLTPCLRELSDVLLRTLGGDVGFGAELPDGLWQTVADRNEIELALINLAVNARDAMPNGGKVVLRSENVELAAAHGKVQPGRYVVISIEDTGTGMAPETLARAVEPFFTTKEEDKGTGLGLSIVAFLLNQMNGHLAIRSELGHGTTVSLYLPAIPPEGFTALPDS